MANKLSRLELLAMKLENELEVTQNGHVKIYDSVEECLSSIVEKMNEILDSE
jgi:hypothetical protein